MRLSVVIPTHNRPQRLRKLLQSLQQQNLDAAIFEIIVVPNLREPWVDDRKFIEDWESFNFKIEISGKRGVNKARNLGLKIARAPIVLFLDDDCILEDQSFLEKILVAHSCYPEAVVIGGCYQVSKNAKAMDKAYNCLSRHWQNNDNFGEYRSSRLVGGNVSYKKNRLLEKNLLFDESISFGATESEFHQRVEGAGFQCLFLDSLKVTHQTELSAGELVRKAIRQAEGHKKFNIEEGFSREHYSTWQPHRLLWAREMANCDQEFDEIVQGIAVYDLAYKSQCENPGVDEDKVVRKVLMSFSKHWQGEVSL